MEDSQPPAPVARSVIDELRAVQLEFLSPTPKTSIDKSNDTATTSGDEGPSLDDEPLTSMSPSEIINSVEQDPVENQEETSPDVPNGLAWDNNPLASHPLDPQQDSASAVDSNAASLTTTTLASGAVDQAPSIGLDGAFAAPFSREFEARLQAPENDQGTISPAQLTGSGYDAEGFGDASSGEDSRVLSNTGTAHLGAIFPGPMDSDRFEDALYRGDLDAVARNDSAKNADTAMPDHHDNGILAFEDTAPNEYLTPLPPPARTRQEMATILKAHREDIRSFISQFTPGSVALSPNSKVAVKIDAMLETLADVSNLPPYHHDLDLSQNEWMRYARDTCSKLSFVYELIGRLREANMEIVILAAGGVVMQKIEAIVSQSNITYRHVQQDWPTSSPGGDSTSACKVVLVDTALRITEPILTANVVVAYDESAESSGLLNKYKTTDAVDQTPMIFTLIEVYSLEHINRRLSPVMDPLERRLAQIKCLDLILQHAELEAGVEHVSPPIDLARELVQYMVEDNKFVPPPVRWDSWEHQLIPSSVLEEYEVFRHNLRRDRKRARRSSSGTEVPKRPRIASTSADEDQLSEAVQKQLGPDISVKGGVAQVSVQKLEDLVTLVSIAR